MRHACVYLTFQGVVCTIGPKDRPFFVTEVSVGMLEGQREDGTGRKSTPHVKPA